MGNFYTNYTISGKSQSEVAAALSDRAAIISPEHNGYVVAYDEQSEAQDFQIITELGARLSLILGSPVLAAVVHDDDILFLQLYDSGEIADEYDSSPGYFDPDAEPSEPSGGDAERLCATFRTTNVAEVTEILRKSSYDDDGLDAVDRHAQLVSALGLPPWTVCAGFNYISDGELPEGLSESDLLRTP